MQKLPVCEDCNERFRCKKNSVTVRYGRTTLQQADRYECPECGRTILTGFGNKFEAGRGQDLGRDKRAEIAENRADVDLYEASDQ